MQLVITRSQRDTGVISKSALFCLDARVQFTADEQKCVNRYKLWNEHIYSSESAHKSMAKADANRANFDAGGGGAFKALAHTIVAAFKLNVTVKSIHAGQHIECKSLDELLFAEACIMTACEKLKEYLDKASTFDGRQVLFDFDTGEAKAVARSVSPNPILVSSSNDIPLVGGPTLPESAYVEGEYQDVPERTMYPYTEEPEHFSPFANLSKHPERIAVGAVLVFLLLATVYFMRSGPATPNTTPNNLSLAQVEQQPSTGPLAEDKPAPAPEPLTTKRDFSDVIASIDLPAGYEGPYFIGNSEHSGEKYNVSQAPSSYVQYGTTFYNPPCVTNQQANDYKGHKVFICAGTQ